MPSKLLVCTLSICLLSSSCATARPPATVHVETSGGDPEHEETVYPNGDVRDVYPDHDTPHEIIFHRHEGGITDMICMNAKCTDVTVQITKSSLLSDGSYQWLQTDDPKVIMVRDREGARILGYIATNHGGVAQSFPDLTQAQEYEHKGDTARTVGKVALGALLVVGLVAVVGAAAAADAQSNKVTTRCVSGINSATCTTYGLR